LSLTHQIFVTIGASSSVVTLHGAWKNQAAMSPRRSVLGMHRQSLQHKLRELGLGRRYVAVGDGPQEKTDD